MSTSNVLTKHPRALWNPSYGGGAHVTVELLLGSSTLTQLTSHILKRPHNHHHKRGDHKQPGHLAHHLEQLSMLVYGKAHYHVSSADSRQQETTTFSLLSTASNAHSPIYILPSPYTIQPLCPNHLVIELKDNRVPTSVYPALSSWRSQ